MSKEPLFFWNGPFSNWYPSKFKDEDGTLYFNNEQYMMRQKAILFNDKENEYNIMNTTLPKEIKMYGRKVKNFDKEKWNQYARDIVTHGCYLKFSQNPKLKAILLSTNKKKIVEASQYDNIWGIGLNEKQARRLPEDKWPGKNWLGECLMRTREILIDKQTKRIP